MKKTYQLYLIIFGLIISYSSLAQSLQGTVTDENNQPIPYVNIFIKELNSGTTTNEQGAYFYNTVAGTYEVVYSAVGYETQLIQTVIKDEDFAQNVVLKTSSIQLDQIVVKAGKRDPAYGIIQKAIDHKKKYAKQINACKTEVYVKASEDIKNLKAPKVKQENIEKDERPTASHLALQTPAIPDSIRNFNFVEMNLTLNFKAPNLYKEERTAYKLYGDQSGLFIPNFSQSDFNFYDNYVALPDITELPFISPLSRTAILSYKYKLVETIEEDGQSIFKIKIIPRKKGNATCSGFIYINENLWNINRLEVQLPKGALKLFDAFQMKLSYQQINDTLWLPQRQQFEYVTKTAKKRNYEGSTLITFNKHQLDCNFEAKFFGNEVSVTTKKAFERDSTYWQQVRSEPLSIKQTQVANYRDSIDLLINSKPYKDSVEALYNKIEPLEILWFGVGLQNHEQKSELYFSSVASLLSFNIIGGLRLGPSADFRRRFDSGKVLRATASPSIGIKHRNFQGYASTSFMYNPHKLARARLVFGRDFLPINLYDAYLNIVQPSNFILADFIRARHRFELRNGLYLTTGFNYTWRQAVPSHITNVFENWFPTEENIFEEPLEEPLKFEAYQSLITEIGLQYTPAQKYVTEPDRKLVLGSHLPTFSLLYQRGWNKLLGSDVDYDYVEFAVEQEVILGQFGNSRYRLSSGSYFNTKNLRYIDRKRFRQSDPWLYSNPLRSFQLLDTALALSSKKTFFEAHYIHHFNGALINNIPLVKQLGIRLVAGGGFLWVQQNKYRHQELFAGLERVFKLGPRRRMRLGVYGVGGNSNQTPVNKGIKFSLDIIDTWKKDWTY